MKRKVYFVLILVSLTAVLWNCKPKEVQSPFEDYFDVANDLAKVSDIEDENWKYIEGPYIDNDYIERTMNGMCPETFWQGDTLILQYGDRNGYCTAPSGRKHWGSVMASHNGQAGPGLQVQIKTMDPPRGSDEEPFALVDFMRSTVVLSDYSSDQDGNPVTIFNWSKETSIKTDDRETVVQSDVILKATQKPQGRFYAYTGQGSGRSGSLEFDFEIIEALEVSPAAPEIVKGKIRVVFHGGETVMIDFGGGEADKMVQIEVAGEKRNFNLHERLVKYTH